MMDCNIDEYWDNAEKLLEYMEKHPCALVKGKPVKQLILDQWQELEKKLEAVTVERDKYRTGLEDIRKHHGFVCGTMKDYSAVYKMADKLLREARRRRNNFQNRKEAHSE